MAAYSMSYLATVVNHCTNGLYELFAAKTFSQTSWLAWTPFSKMIYIRTTKMFGPSQISEWKDHRMSHSNQMGMYIYIYDPQYIE
jgi:hypothetical protein